MSESLENTSFMRSLCMGRVEEALLFPFPKMKKEEQETLRTLAQSFQQWLGHREKEFRKWDHEGEMPKEFIQEMREFGLFSLIIPEQFGGLGLSATGYSRVLQELTRYDGSIVLTAGAHSSIGMRGLVLFGNDAQKNKYLPKLATGEMIAAFCLTEANAGSDAASLKTKAVEESDHWLLNGEKIWITNGGMADFFTVFARTESKDSGGKAKITAFIVTKDMAGVSHGPHEDKMGIRASSTTTISFVNVKVPKENVLGEVGNGFKVAMNILNSGRTGLGGGCVGAMKYLIEQSTKQAKQRKQFEQPIANFGLIKQKVGKMVVNTYAAESVVNMVAGMVDRGHKDYAVEAAISKIFASEALWDTVDEALQIAGGNGFMREFPYERIMRNCRINRIFEGTNEILRLFVALTAMNDVGASLKEVASAMGNALHDPIKGFGVLSDYAKRRVTQVTGLGKVEMTKSHPAIAEHARLFEELTRQLASAADRILRKHGKNIMNKQFATRRLADIMIDLYVFACIISRVSQSLQENGVAKSSQELEILEIFAGDAQRRIQQNFDQIDNNNDELIKSVADFAFEQEKFSWDNI
jgi:acyl-CoA dehydrogenase family protein 9